MGPLSRAHGPEDLGIDIPKNRNGTEREREGGSEQVLGIFKLTAFYAHVDLGQTNTKKQ